MLGRFEEAHALIAKAADNVAELGLVRFETYVASRRSTLRCSKATHCARRRQRGRRAKTDRHRASSATSCGTAATWRRRWFSSGETQGARLAREAVALAAETDMLNVHADALLDLADVLALAAPRQGGRASAASCCLLHFTGRK
jgi:hypothetical protein